MEKGRDGSGSRVMDPAGDYQYPTFEKKKGSEMTLKHSDPTLKTGLG